MKGIQIPINNELKILLPEAYEILRSSQLTVHPFVYKVVLTGSRGLAGNYKEHSDIDLSLMAEIDQLRNSENEEIILNEILNTTILTWKSSVELDTAVIFDISNCKLNCFDTKYFEHRSCKENGIDCFGIYKTQKGFKGYVPKIGVDMQKVYPMITVWEREKNI